jgi:hypothetical protein
MPLSADDFRSLADQFTALARSIVIFEGNNPTLSDSDFHAIDRLRVTALDYSDHLLIAAIQQTLKDLDAPLSQIANATGKMNQALRTLNNVAKAIAITIAGIQLGAAIMTGQIPAIGPAVANIVQAIGSGSDSSSGSPQSAQTSSQP